MRKKNLTEPQKKLLQDLLDNGSDNYTTWGGKLHGFFRSHVSLATVNAMSSVGCISRTRGDRTSYDIAITEKGKQALRLGFTYVS